MRAFLALPVPDDWVAPLMRAQGAVPGGRDVDADDLHVTLAFLDDQPEDALEALHETLEARPLPAARLAPMAYAAFGTPPRIAALDLARDEALTRLRDTVRAAARSAGIDLPRERFRPHVTLKRASRTRPFDAARLPGRLAALGPPPMAPAPASAVMLWGSTLTPQGPIYDVLATYPLPQTEAAR